MLDVGILQGRLSPSLDGRFQFFPLDWQSEFHIAANLGFSCIEWLLDWPELSTNPFLIKEQQPLIREVSQQTGVFVSSVCADYLMKYKLIGKEVETSISILIQLIQAASHLTKNKLILLPLLEDNAYHNDVEKKEVISNLKPAIKVAEDLGVRIGLETEMPVSKLVQFIDCFNSAALGVYYDVGNCTSYGFDCPADLRLLRDRVFGIHLKDRKVGSTQSVTLGSGDADLKGCLKALEEIQFKGDLIMQAWRGNDFLQDAREQLRFIKQLFV